MTEIQPPVQLAENNKGQRREREFQFLIGNKEIPGYANAIKEIHICTH